MKFPSLPKNHEGTCRKKAGRDPRYGPSHFPHVNWPEALRVPRRGKGRRQRGERCSPPAKISPGKREGTRAMMRLPLFEFRAPRTLEEAARILDGERANAMPLAGGTDLLRT